MKSELQKKNRKARKQKLKVMKRAITNQSHENKKQYDCELHRVPLTTKNENEMKTKNNVQKAVLRSAAVVVSFVLISFTVSAQTFWKRLLENTGFSDIAIAMAAPAELLLC
jgi:hypothetical protein